MERNNEYLCRQKWRTEWDRKGQKLIDSELCSPEHLWKERNERRIKIIQHSQIVKRPERAKAYSPGQRPGYKGRQKLRPVRATEQYEWTSFALTGRNYTSHKNPGRCPGLWAFALSGRTSETWKIQNSKLKPHPGELTIEHWTLSIEHWAFKIKN